MSHAKLFLVGASGLAAEAVESLRESGARVPEGVLDDDAGRWGQTVCGIPVLGGLDRLQSYASARVLVCTGKGSTRESLVKRISALSTEVHFPVSIHPSVRVPTSCAVGAGSILLAGVVLTARVVLGEHVVIMPNAVLTHDDAVADYATVCAGVSLGGHVSIGRRAYLGMGAKIRERTEVGPDALVGMGAVVIDDVEPRQVVAGVPARPLSAISSRPPAP